MKVQELIDKSPIRVFDKSINGGLGNGNIAVITSRHGVGKTACMVHLAIDKILQNKNIVHVSFGANVEHIMNWYKEVFKQITDYKSLDDAVEVYETLKSKRVMLNFSQENVSMDKIILSLETLINAGSFKADAVFFDGYGITANSCEDFAKIKKFAQEMGVEAWICVSPSATEKDYDEYGIAASLKAHTEGLDVLVGLHYNDEKSRVIMTVAKDHKQSPAHPAGTSLDPKTMLIAE